MRHDATHFDVLALDQEIGMTALPHKENPRIKKGDRLVIHRPGVPELHYRVKAVHPQDDEWANIDIIEGRLIDEDPGKEDQPHTEAEEG